MVGHTLLILLMAATGYAQVDVYSSEVQGSVSVPLLHRHSLEFLTVLKLSFSSH